LTHSNKASPLEMILSGSCGQLQHITSDETHVEKSCKGKLFLANHF